MPVELTERASESTEFAVTEVQDNGMGKELYRGHKAGAYDFLDALIAENDITNWRFSNLAEFDRNERNVFNLTINGVKYALRRTKVG